MKNKFARVFEYPALDMQIVLMVTQNSENETYGIEIITYHESIGAEVKLTVGGWKDRETATENMEKQTDETTLGLFKDLLKEFNIDIDEYIK